MSAVAEQRGELRELQREYDALNRAVDEKHEEFDRINADIRRELARLEKIRSEIARIKTHFGVKP